MGIKAYKYLDRALSKLPGKRYYSSGQLEKPRSDEHRRTRKESSWRFRGPVTLPSQGRVHRSPGLQELSFLGYYKILTSHKLQQIGGRRPPSYLLQFMWKSKFYKYLDRALSKLPGREVLLFRATEKSLDLMNIVERERRAPGGSGDR